MKIDIDKRRDLIIIEKGKANTIYKGSHLFCGCCGESLGVTKEVLELPFDSQHLKNNLQKRTFVTNSFGLYHTTCKNTMFSFDKPFSFIQLIDYKIQTSKKTLN